MVPVPEPYTDGQDLQTKRSWVAFRRAVHIPIYTEDPVGYAPKTAAAAISGGNGGQGNAGTGNVGAGGPAGTEGGIPAAPQSPEAQPNGH